jgi:small subunit ribosomal protein S1
MTVKRRRRGEPQTANTNPTAAPIPEPVVQEQATEAPPMPTPTVEAKPEIYQPKDTPAKAIEVRKESVVKAPSRTKKPAPLVEEKVEEEVDEDFEALFAESSAKSGRMNTDFQVGDQVTGTVAAITNETIFVDLGSKSEGSIGRGEFVDSEGVLKVALGDEITAFINNTRYGIELTTALGGGQHSSEQLQQAYESKIPIEGKVTGFNKGGLEVTVAGNKAFCPSSQVERGFVSEFDAYVGQTLTFRITRMEGTRNIVLSRRILLEELSAAMAEETRGKLKEGAILKGQVRSIQDFGVFVDLGGIDGMVHASEISWEAVSEQTSLVSIGETVEVQVMRIDKDANRIALSIKRAQRDPWLDNNPRSMEGQTRQGTVRRLETYGAFVDVGGGLEGLLHISEITGRRISHPREVMSVGDKIEVVIMEVDQKSQRLSLSMNNNAAGSGWSAVDGVISEGSLMDGTIERIERYGVFVKLSPDVTGLVPGGETGKDRNTDLKKVFNVGDSVSVVVKSIDSTRRRISLSMTDVVRIEEQQNVQDYLNRSSVEETSAKQQVGSFGALLQAKLDALKK